MGNIEKNVIFAGVFGIKPVEDAKCIIKLSNLVFECSSDPYLEWTSIKTIFQEGDRNHLIIGDVDYDFDKLIESAVKTMHNKEVSDFILKASITLNQISHDISVKVRIELISLINMQYVHDLPSVHKAYIARKHKDRGVDFFKKQEYLLAFKRFSKALKLLISLGPYSDSGLNDVDYKIVFDLKRDLYNNLALCRQCMKSKNPEVNLQHIVYLCNKVLEIDSNNIKALMRLAKAKTELRDFEEARDVVSKILEIEPNYSSAKSEMIKLTTIIKEQNKNSDSIVKKMFGNLS